MSPDRPSCCDAIDEGLLVRLLACAPLFTSVGRQGTARLLPHVRVQRFHDGDVLFPQDADCSDLWVVLGGQVALQQRPGRRLLARRETGELIGATSVFEPTPWGFTATATADGTAASIRHAAVRDWVDMEPRAARWFLRHFATRVQRDLPTHSSRTRPDVGARVARTLLHLADRYTVDGTVRHGLSQQHLADLAGASRETVNKVLADFAARGWLIVQRGSCVLVDERALHSRATTSPLASQPKAPAPCPAGRGRQPGMRHPVDRGAVP